MTMADLTKPTGSLMNNIAANSKYPDPVVGMGATRLSWTDRDPFTIVEVIDARTIVVQEDEARRIDRNGMSECQTYEFTPDPDARRVTLTFRKNGRWVEKGSPMGGTPYAVGHREKYHDYSF
jgi:hypothetical protein